MSGIKKLCLNSEPVPYGCVGFICDRPLGHEGPHGAGNYAEWKNVRLADSINKYHPLRHVVLEMEDCE